eukprot:10798715-Ditylum_brightwellii.AAC.1
MKEVKITATKDYISRVRKILNAQLLAHITMTAIGTYVVPEDQKAANCAWPPPSAGSHQPPLSASDQMQCTNAIHSRVNRPSA